MKPIFKTEIKTRQMIYRHEAMSLVPETVVQIYVTA